MLRKFVMILMIIIAYLLQSTLFQTFSLGGVSPNILIILTSCFGFMGGKKEGMFVGFISGMILDVLFGRYLGVYSIIYLFIGYLNGMFSSIFYPEDIKLPMILITSSELIYCFVIYISLFLLRGRFNFGYYFLHIILPEIVYTILVTILLYRGILAIHEMLLVREKRNS